MKALIYTMHLYGMGGGAKAVLWIARAMKTFMPTEIAVTTPVSPAVKRWIPDIPIVQYRRGMEKDYEILWNIDHFNYALPLAKRNLAHIFHPHEGNTPPPQFELFGNSDYTSNAVEDTWEKPCETIYIPIDVQPEANAIKESIILNVARFVAPSQYADKGHIAMIQAFRAIQDAGCNWQLVFIGSLDPGHGAFLDRLMTEAQGLNVRFIANADQEVVNHYYSIASIYWHMTGIGLPEISGAQEHFGLAPLEGQRCGAVPIVNASGGHLETIRHQFDGWHVHSPQELADATMAMVGNLSGWSLLSQRGQVAGHTWTNQSAFVERMKAVLEERPIPKVERFNWLNVPVDRNEVCAVIPVHNQKMYTERCLGFLWALTPEVKIILVDNASTDDTPSLKPLVEAHGGIYLRREVNDGFAASNMAAKEYCDRPFVLMLNNDVESVAEDTTSWLDIMLAEMSNSQVGIVGPKLIYPDGRIQFGGMRYDKTREDIFFHAGYGQPDAPQYNMRVQTFAVTGACMLVRRELFDLDVSLTMNYEDIDLCLETAKKGFQIIYQPAAKMIHYEAKTKKAVGVSDMVEESKRRFMEKHKEDI